MENSTSFGSNQNQTGTSHSAGTTTRQELTKFSDMLGFFAFFFIILGLLSEIWSSGAGYLSLLGLSSVIIGCVFLASFLYIKVKLIETR